MNFLSKFAQGGYAREMCIIGVAIGLGNIFYNKNYKKKEPLELAIDTMVKSISFGIVGLVFGCAPIPFMVFGGGAVIISIK